MLILIDTLRPAGAERVAVNLALAMRESDQYLPLVCASRCGGELESLLERGG